MKPYVITDKLAIKQLINNLYTSIHEKDREISKLKAENRKLFTEAVIKLQNK